MTVAVANDDTGWLAEARRVPSPNCDERPPGAGIDLVVIHAISLPPGEFGGPHVCELFQNRLARHAHPYFAQIADQRVSAHFLIDRQGVLTQFVDIRARAWHAGASSWEGRNGCNDYSIGIELEGADDRPFTDAQYAALVRLIDALRARLPRLSPERIVGHCDIAPARKTDPGPCFDWARLRRDLGCASVNA